MWIKRDIDGFVQYASVVFIDGWEAVTEATVMNYRPKTLEQKQKDEANLYDKRDIDGRKWFHKWAGIWRQEKLANIITPARHLEIETELTEVRNEIMAGQWATGKIKLEALGFVILGQTLYDELLDEITNYITENYG